VKIAIGCDHGGLDLKNLIAVRLEEEGFEIRDMGTFSEESVDYPDFSNKVCQCVRSGECERGILICGTGIGMSIAANRYREIRAALCHEAFTARMSREHNDANILCLGARVVGTEVALDIVRVWATTEFAGGRHQRRLDLLS
jgi:ribose 5-phosphate isomerase B